MLITGPSRLLSAILVTGSVFTLSCSVALKQGAGGSEPQQRAATAPHLAGLRISTRATAPEISMTDSDCAEYPSGAAAGPKIREAVEAALDGQGLTVVTDPARPSDATLVMTLQLATCQRNGMVEGAIALRLENEGAVVASARSPQEWLIAVSQETTSVVPNTVSALLHEPRLATLDKTHGEARKSKEPAGAIVAVFDVQDAAGRFDAKTLDQLTDYIAIKASEVVGVRVVPRADLRQRLQQEKSGSYRACVDESCQIELGKSLAADKSLSTKLLKVGAVCVMTATLFDLKTEVTEKSASAKTSCDDNGLIGGADEILPQLRSAQANMKN